MSRLLATALLLCAAPVQAATIVLDFEEEPTGGRDGGYTSIECGCVSFTHSFLPADQRLHFDVFGAQGDGQALLVGEDDDGGGLLLEFMFSPDIDVVALSLEFGNDDPDILDELDDAILQAFDGDTLVGEVRVKPNLNDVMDQSISISGVGAFDRAFFQYSDSIDEIVDNFVFETVPEPPAALLWLLGAAGLARQRLYR